MGLFSKDKVSSFFTRNFSFEGDINLEDEYAVLFRRNIVIMNIMLVSNLIYTLLLFVITFKSGSSTDWVISILALPGTFIMNKTIKKLIYHEDKQILRQQIVMYLSTFYIFLSAILLYLKLSFGTGELKEAGYMLLFYALIVVSLYQDRKMLKVVFSWMLCIVTIIHLAITHPIRDLGYESMLDFALKFPNTPEARDIFFRTAIMLCFMLVVYTICVIGEKMSHARNQELAKRQDIQEDFMNIVTNLFDVLITSRVDDNDYENSDILSAMTRKLASVYGYQPSKCNELAEYALFLDQHKNDFKLDYSSNDNDDMFEILRNQSELGTQLVRRIELASKTVNIIRAHVEDNVTDEFVFKMNNIQKNIDSEIILLSDIYITLRRYTGYKRPYPHTTAIDTIRNNLHHYFDSNLLDRFLKFQVDFEKMYDES